MGMTMTNISREYVLASIKDRASFGEAADWYARCPLTGATFQVAADVAHTSFLPCPCHWRMVSCEGFVARRPGEPSFIGGYNFDGSGYYDSR